MSITIPGVVTNGVVVPDSPLPEGARVAIQLQPAAPEVQPAAPPRFTPTELRRMPREQRQAILAAAAEMAEQDYRFDKELTGFAAFSEEELDDDDKSDPVRGEVWRIRFDPAEGDEIKKIRTAAVISENAIGRLKLKIVVPITEWKSR